MAGLREYFNLSEAPLGNARGMTREPGIPKAYGGGKSEPTRGAAKPFKPAAGPQIFTAAGDGDKSAGGPGLRVSGDPNTLEILNQALELLSKHGADDDAEWADDALRAMSGAKDGNVTLPRFEATPSLDSFDDDAGGSDEDY